MTRKKKKISEQTKLLKRLVESKRCGKLKKELVTFRSTLKEEPTSELDNNHTDIGKYESSSTDKVMSETKTIANNKTEHKKKKTSYMKESHAVVDSQFNLIRKNEGEKAVVDFTDLKTELFNKGDTFFTNTEMIIYEQDTNNNNLNKTVTTKQEFEIKDQRSDSVIEENVPKEIMTLNSKRNAIERASSENTLKEKPTSDIKNKHTDDILLHSSSTKKSTNEKERWEHNIKKKKQIFIYEQTDSNDNENSINKTSESQFKEHAADLNMSTNEGTEEQEMEVNLVKQKRKHRKKMSYTKQRHAGRGRLETINIETDEKVEENTNKISVDRSKSGDGFITNMKRKESKQLTYNESLDKTERKQATEKKDKRTDTSQEKQTSYMKNSHSNRSLNDRATSEYKTSEIRRKKRHKKKKSYMIHFQAERDDIETEKMEINSIAENMNDEDESRLQNSSTLNQTSETETDENQTMKKRKLQVPENEQTDIYSTDGSLKDASESIFTKSTEEPQIKANLRQHKRKNKKKKSYRKHRCVREEGMENIDYEKDETVVEITSKNSLDESNINNCIITKKKRKKSEQLSDSGTVDNTKKVEQANEMKGTCTDNVVEQHTPSENLTLNSKAYDTACYSERDTSQEEQRSYIKSSYSNKSLDDGASLEKQTPGMRRKRQHKKKKSRMEHRQAERDGMETSEVERNLIAENLPQSSSTENQTSETKTDENHIPKKRKLHVPLYEQTYIYNNEELRDTSESMFKDQVTESVIKSTEERGIKINLFEHKRKQKKKKSYTKDHHAETDCERENVTIHNEETVIEITDKDTDSDSRSTNIKIKKRNKNANCSDQLTGKNGIDNDTSKIFTSKMKKKGVNTYTIENISSEEHVLEDEISDSYSEGKSKKTKMSDHEFLDQTVTECHKNDIPFPVKSEKNYTKRRECSLPFEFYISRSEWQEIKPEIKVYGGKGKVSRRMKGKWTDVFSAKANEEHKGCVLSFQSHNVKKDNSRKIMAPFLMATATCKGSFCHTKYTFIINDEPNDQDDVLVHCTTKGCIEHGKDEVNRRHLKGLKRVDIGEQIAKSGSVNVYCDSLLNSDTSQLKHGNFTAVPNPTVLRKIVSEQVKKEQLHSNIMAELQLLKESYEDGDDPYIREIGLDPFCIIVFSDKQIEILKQFGSSVCIHLDATGGVIPSIPGQKRPYLYSLVMKPNPHVPAVSIADMITTQHHIPRIEYFLSVVNREAKLTGKKIEIQQIETDFSYALMQAALKTFNNMDLKRYLIFCYSVLSTKNKSCNYTVLHLCSAHIFRDFIKQLKKYQGKVNKSNRKLILQSFALLQNSQALEEGLDIFKEMCHVFGKRKSAKTVVTSLGQLQKRIKGINEIENMDDEQEDHPHEEGDIISLNEYGTIRQASPFDGVFQTIVQQVEEQDEIEEESDNDYFCENVIKCLIERCMYLIPLWSGMMLFYTRTGQSRNTNSNVESWFKVLKQDCAKRKMIRPARFVMLLRKLVYSRLTELIFPGARQKKTKSKPKTKDDTGIDITLQEEIWDRLKSKKVKYQPVLKSKTNISQSKNELPSVSGWGGDIAGQSLSNTCTIDNGLTILHLKYTDAEEFKRNISSKNSELFQTLQTIFALMSEKCYTAAKFVWVNFTQKFSPVLKNTRNLFGDETGFFFSYFDPEWRSRVLSTCLESLCPNPFKESNEIQGVTVSLTKPVESMQQIVDLWLENETTCRATHEETDIAEETQITVKRCQGNRRNQRRVLLSSPVLVLRVHEHFTNGRVTLNHILNQTEIYVHEKRYVLAGCTLHRHGHFCAIVCTTRTGNVWYDGLHGKLQPVVTDIDTWSPSHVIYCQI